jgi:hypothetical protein
VPTYTPASATLQYNISAPRTIGSEWVPLQQWVVVINGNQTTTLNGAKIFNTGIPLIINSGAKLASGANSLTGGDFINNGAYLPQLAPLLQVG